MVIFLRGSDPQTRQCLDNRCVNKTLRLEDGKHDIHIIASQNVKIPGQMDLIRDKWSIPGQSREPWMVGRYALAYKNLHKMRGKIKLVIVIIKFYFKLLSVHIEAFFASLA